MFHLSQGLSRIAADEGSYQAIETQKSEIENSNASAICDLPSAISEPTADSNTENRINPESSITAESPCDSAPSRLCVENSVSPPIETQKSKIENSPHPDLLTCASCNAHLPPLHPDGQRPSPFRPKCRWALRHPATLKFYCPTCRGSIHNIWDQDNNVRTSDTCPRCYSDLPPPPIWPPLPASTKSPETTGQLAHAE